MKQPAAGLWGARDGGRGWGGRPIAEQIPRCLWTSGLQELLIPGTSPSVPSLENQQLSLWGPPSCALTPGPDGSPPLPAALTASSWSTL